MTNQALRDAARMLASELRMAPQNGSVWAWIEHGKEQIVVELRRPATGMSIPHHYRGFPVVTRRNIEPSVKGIQIDLLA